MVVLDFTQNNPSTPYLPADCCPGLCSKSHRYFPLQPRVGNGEGLPFPESEGQVFWVRYTTFVNAELVGLKVLGDEHCCFVYVRKSGVISGLLYNCKKVQNLQNTQCCLN